MNPDIVLLSRFKEGICKFMDSLSEWFPNEPGLTHARIAVKEVPSLVLMTQFIKHGLPHKDQITERDESFFLNGTDIFNFTDQHSVNQIKHIWETANLKPDEKESIWQWFDFFIKCSKKYYERNPTVV